MKVRLLSPWRQTELTVADFRFSVSFSPEEADALLCEWAPQPEILNFGGPKAWYCCEAVSNGIFRSPDWRRFLQQLDNSEFLYHSHPDPRYRVPHITHIYDDIVTRCSDQRLSQGIAIVSNSGGSPWRRQEEMSLRLKFVTHRSVDLYGQYEAWANFRARPLSRSQLPLNYRGEVEGAWTSRAKIDLMSRYKVAICLENTSEAYYFTEKFVDAVQAGCIPVYHAHETVRDGILKEAIWVDPVSFNYNVDKTMDYALSQDIIQFWSINSKWLNGESLRRTSLSAVFERIGRILCQNA